MTNQTGVPFFFSKVSRSRVALATLVLAGCGSGAGKTTTPQTATAAVTPAEGGTVALPDNSAHIDIPAGAVTSNTTITVSTTDATPPAGITAASPILKFEPDGLVFTKPVTVTFTFANATRPIVYWSNSSGGYDPIAGTVSGSTISAQVMHFSSGFVADAPATAGAANCGEGVACVAGATCGYGASGAAMKSGSGATTAGGSTMSNSGAPAPNDPGTSTTRGALCASNGGSTSAPTKSGSGSGASTTSDPGSGNGGSPAAGVDASAPATDTTMCGSATTTSGDSMCCSCGTDGKFHCSGCGGSLMGGGTPTTDASKDGGSSGNPTGMTCASGAACAPGQMCGSGGTSGAGMCCSCGADGTYQCGVTCPGQSAPDGGPTSTGGLCVPGGACTFGGGRCGSASSGGACVSMCDCGSDGKYVCSSCDGGGAVPPAPDAGNPAGDGTCVPGSACSPGAGCKGASPSGQCLNCMCAAGGTLQCTQCPGSTDAGAPPAPDGGGSTPPPATCQPGLACPTGYMCKTPGTGGVCTMCTCGGDGLLTCGACPGAPDAGAPPQTDAGAAPNIPPAACFQGADCPQAGLGCNNGMPPGNGCSKCACGPNMQLMCNPC